MDNNNAAAVAAILNAGYHVRMLIRPHQRARQLEAYELMAAATRAGLDRAGSAETVLLAVRDALETPRR